MIIGSRAQFCQKPRRQHPAEGQGEPGNPLCDPAKERSVLLLGRRNGGGDGPDGSQAPERLRHVFRMPCRQPQKSSRPRNREDRLSGFPPGKASALTVAYSAAARPPPSARRAEGEVAAAALAIAKAGRGGQRPLFSGRSNGLIFLGQVLGGEFPVEQSCPARLPDISAAHSGNPDNRHVPTHPR